MPILKILIYYTFSVAGSHKIPDKNLITPDRRDILSEPEALPSGAEAPLGRNLSRRLVPPMLEVGLDLQQAPLIDSGHQ